MDISILENTSDVISRQAAIDAASEIVFVEYEDGDPRKEESIILQTKAAIRDRIKALPPVQTEIIHCKDCLYKKICSWKHQGATFCSFGERGDTE